MEGGKFVLTLVKVIGICILVIFFGIYLMQIDNLEKQLLNTRNRLTSIEETNIKISETLNDLKRIIKSGKMSVSAVQGRVSGPEKQRKWLHPEVDNCLVEDNFEITVMEAKTDGKITRWYGNSEIKGMNIITENASDLASCIQEYVNEGLAERHMWTDPDKWKPMLAERIEIVNDYRDYVVYLRKGVKWHKPVVDWSNPRYEWLKGDHYFTTRDIKFSVDMILNPQVEAGHLRNYYQDLDSLEVIDDYTCIFHWKKKTYNSIDSTLGFSSLVPEFIFAYDEDGVRYDDSVIGFKFNNHWYNHKAIGTGPYQFVSYEPGVAVKLRRFEDYWGEKPAIKEITWLLFNDSNQNLLKIKSGEIDFGGLTPTQYREEILNAAETSPFATGKIEYRKTLVPVYWYLGWNADKEIFADKRVRRAMTHACNREDICKNIFHGLRTVVTGPAYLNSPSYDKSIKPYEFDLDKARTLLEEAGWKDTDGDGILDKIINGQKTNFEFNLLMYAGSAEWTSAMTVFKEDLLKIGVKMNIQAVEWSLMQKKMNDKEFDAFTGGWGLGWTFDPYQIWHSSQADEPGGSNRVGFRNAEADRIIEQLRETFDQEKRIKLAHAFHALLHEEQPYTFLFAPNAVNVWHNHVKRVIFKKHRPITSSLPWYID